MHYQLDLTTPGNSPLSASKRKQRRHILNLRKKDRGLPQRGQRFLCRVLNLGFKLIRTILHFLDNFYLLCILNLFPKRHSQVSEQRSTVLIFGCASFDSNC